MKTTSIPYKNIYPEIHENTFIAPNSSIIGKVSVGEGTNIWYGAILRGDVQSITIGKDTNIQDGTVIHLTTGGQGTHIGDRVTVGHQALLHDCTIEDEAYIGMQSLVMDGVVVESRAFLAAGSLVPTGKRIPSGQLWGGRPAKYMRDLNDNDYKTIDWSWKHYRELGFEHRENCKNCEKTE
jgi:carbonic anhydrase/acetyltransferase-like protein (isoleucine patch superfamily)